MEEGLGGSKWGREAGLTQTPFALVRTWVFMPGAKGSGEGNEWMEEARSDFQFENNHPGFWLENGLGKFKVGCGQPS